MPVANDAGQPAIRVANDAGQPAMPVANDAGQPAMPVANDAGQPAMPVANDAGQPAMPVANDAGQPAMPVANDAGHARHARGERCGRAIGGWSCAPRRSILVPVPEDRDCFLVIVRINACSHYGKLSRRRHKMCITGQDHPGYGRHVRLST